MRFRSDRRSDLSGVPEDLVGRPHSVAPPSGQPGDSRVPPILRMLAWLLIPAAIGFAIAFAGFDHPLLGPPPASQPGNSVRSVRDDPAVSERQEWVEETRRAAMQDVAKASSEAERQHDRAMKAVEAARALAENPDSANAREALDRAMADIAKGDQSSLPPDRADWTAEDYARAMREGRSLTD